MTPRERVLAVLRGEPVDKVPFTIYEPKIPQCAVERRLRNEGLCIVNRLFPVVKRVKPNCVTESHTFTTANGRQRIRHVTRTPVGEITEVVELAGFTTWTVERQFKSPDDYKTLLYIAKDTQCLPDYEAYVAAEKWMGDDVILRANVPALGLHWIMIEAMGVEMFSEEWAERRDEVLKLEHALSENARKMFPIVADAPITHGNIGGNEVPEVMGPQRYRQFCLPLINECAEAFHKKGRLLGSHMDGNNKPWAADLAASGLDYIEAFTPAPDTDMTLPEALQVWKNKVLWINFPSSIHLSSIEKIKQTARELIEAAAGTNRLIMGITEDIPPDRWQQNLLAISEVINEYKR